MYNNCKTVNIIWIERGIILTIIYYILKYHDELLNKKIIIDNEAYCKFFRILFPKLKFNIYDTHHKLNFYFNFRRIIKNQDIIIDYLSNYDNIINASKIALIPWYDTNDPIIVYKYNSKKELKVNKYKTFIKEFSNCKRGNYNGVIWDAIIENKIIKRYIAFSKNNYNQFLTFFNNFIKSNYTNTVIEKPQMFYVPMNKKRVIEIETLKPKPNVKIEPPKKQDDIFKIEPPKKPDDIVKIEPVINKEAKVVKNKPLKKHRLMSFDLPKEEIIKTELPIDDGTYTTMELIFNKILTLNKLIEKS